MKQVYITLLFILINCQVVGQQVTITGKVMDTLNSNPLFRSSVTLIRPADSVIISYTRTKPDGTFTIAAPEKGKYTLQITFPGFADYLEIVNAATATTQLGILPLVSKEHLLKEFVLTQQIAAIKIKGDTTEYMADSFKVKDNATVEDLLKRLPGIQVDKNGNITAQGETVQKILVDGEEFFSDDPKVVTQGLQANVVDKVQVYDKKSDQAEFTGIDDGQKTKTINLELKDDKKKGYFGKVDAGGGTDGYFQNQGMINAFRPKSQLSAFGIMSNTDKVGLGWADNDNFGSGNGVTEISDDGGIMTSFNTNTDQDLGGWNGQYTGEGLPKVWTGGVHFADRWDDDAEHVTGNYRYAMQDLEITGNTTTQYVLPGDSGFVSRENKNQFSKGQRNGMDFMYEWKIDSSSSLKLTMNAGEKTTQTSSTYWTNTLTENDSLINTNNRNITSNANADFCNADLLFRKKFKKKGRTLSLDVKENYKQATSNGFLNSSTQLFLGGDTLSTLIDQQKKSATYTLAAATKATYTEPLSKVAYLELNYGVIINNSLSSNYSYEKPQGSSQYSLLNDTFSSDYKYNILSNIGGVAFKFVYEKINFSFGSDISNEAFNQTNLFVNDSNKKYTYVNLFPKATFNYKISKQTNLLISYTGNTKQPTISQVQPLAQNTDPLNITLGNTSLKQQFTNTINLRFNDFKVLTSKYLWANVTFNFFENAISTSQQTYEGINTTQYVNVNGNYNGNGFIGYGFKLKKTDMNIGIQANSSINHTNNLINSENNTSNTNTYGFGPYFNYNKDAKWEAEWSPAATYNANTSTISTYASNYWSVNSRLSGSVQLTHKFEIGSSLDAMIREKTAVFNENNNVFKWNAFVGKKFLKKSQLELKASANDILNQNIGYNRMAQAGFITQDNYNTIRRYGMLSLVWNFSHAPVGTVPVAHSDMMMMR